MTARTSSRSYTPLEWAGWLAIAKRVLCPDRAMDLRCLDLFMQLPGQVFDHARILDGVGSVTTCDPSRLSGTHVSRLSRALADVGFRGAIILHRNIGYSLRADDAARILAYVEGFADPARAEAA